MCLKSIVDRNDMVIDSDHRWTRSKILEGGVVSFPEGGGVNFSSQRGVTPPDPPKNFDCGSHYFLQYFFH